VLTASEIIVVSFAGAEPVGDYLSESESFKSML